MFADSKKITRWLLTLPMSTNANLIYQTKAPTGTELPFNFMLSSYLICTLCISPDENGWSVICETQKFGINLPLSHFFVK